MINRRSFLKAGSALALAGMLPGLSRGSSLFNSFAASYPPIGLQTYTLGFLLNNKEIDTKTALKQIADIGIVELETATAYTDGLYYGHKPKEFAAMVNDLGMKWIGNHVFGVMPANNQFGKLRNFRDNLQEVVDEATEGGCPWVICSMSAESTMDEIKETTQVFINAGEAARKNGMKFAYHNHEAEFKKIDGVSAYNYILDNTNKDEVFMEVDLAWATQAGMDPVEMFKEYPGRFPLWHVKDIDPSTNRPTSVGKGKIDFKRIFENSELSGVQHTFIEQDGAKAIDDVAASVKWLKTNIYA